MGGRANYVCEFILADQVFLKACYIGKYLEFLRFVSGYLYWEE